MARTLTEAKISTRAERKRLAVSPKLYFRGIDPDVHLGYRKGKRGGVWIVRWRTGRGYDQTKIGTADDEVAIGTLDFDAAVRLAKKVVEERRKAAIAASTGSALSVASIVENYMRSRDDRDSFRFGRRVNSDARSRLEKYVTGRPSRGNRQAVEAQAISQVAFHELSEEHIKHWREGLPDRVAGTTRQRLINDFRAALNEGYSSNRSRLPMSISEAIGNGFKQSASASANPDNGARDNQILPDRAVGKILAAAREVDAELEAEGDLYRMLVVLAATGARFSQVARLQVGDVQIGESRLMVPTSRKGRGAKVAATPVPIGADIIKALKPAIDGRPEHATLLEVWHKKQVPGSIRWEKEKRGPWKSPSLLTRPWKLIRERSGLPEGIVPYALRHSSIVRGIRAKLPTYLVAKLHDTSVAKIEQHYGRYIADGLDELAARAVVPLIG